jgi:hypothetical protein
MMIITKNWEGGKVTEASQENFQCLLYDPRTSYSRGPMPWRAGPFEVGCGGVWRLISWYDSQGEVE